MGTDSIVDANCNIPKHENDITDEWIKKTVGMSPLPNSLSVLGNIQNGVGFLSNLCRVSFQTQEGVQQNILVKLLPDSPDFRALTLGEKFDEREIQFYSIVQPKILEVAPNLKKNFCKVYCGKTSKSADCNTDDDYASMLVMEDLKPFGYQMLNPESEKWQENLGQVMQFLAKFHCAGLTLEQTSKSKIGELFPFCMGVGEHNLEMLLGLAQLNAPRLDAFLEANKCAPDVRLAYKEIADETEEYFVKVLKECSNYPCLIHGDIWPSNIMVTESGKDPVKIIDWQLLSLRDPTVELSVAILTCIPKAQLKREILDNFCTIYLDTCEAEGSDFGRGKKEFQEFFDTWGMVYAYFWLLLSLDSFPDDMERIFMLFEFVQKEYKISEFLKSCKE